MLCKCFISQCNHGLTCSAVSYLIISDHHTLQQRHVLLILRSDPDHRVPVVHINSDVTRGVRR